MADPTYSSLVNAPYVNAASFSGFDPAGATDSWQAIQNAIQLCFGPSNGSQAATPWLNLPLHIPGKPIITQPLVFPKMIGGRVFGKGRLSTQITNVNNGSVIVTNGADRCAFEGMRLNSGATAIVFDLNYDGDTTYPGALQSNRFQDIETNGGNYGVNIARGSFMGSENLFLNCFLAAHATAGIQTSAANALQNTMVGGNIQGCGRGLYGLVGSITLVDSVGFQQNTTWDIDCPYNAGDATVVNGVRTESTNFASCANGHHMVINGSTQVGLSSGSFLFAGGRISVSGCYSLLGQIQRGGGIQGFIRNSEFGRADWIDFRDTANNDLWVEGVQFSGGRVVKAYYYGTPAGGASLVGLQAAWPLLQTKIAIPSGAGTASIPLLANTRVKSVEIILDTPGSAGIVSVGDGGSSTRYFSGASLTGGNLVSATTERLYASADAIAIACIGSAGVTGYVAVNYQVENS